MIKILFPLWGLLLWNMTATGQQQLAYQKPMAATDSLVPAKEIILKGKVFSGDERTGMPGVTARVKVGNKGTTTLVDGSYSLKVHENSTVIFSQMGYISQQIPVNGRTSIDVYLEKDVKSLNETVIIGYGSQKRANVLGAVTAVNAAEIEDLPVANLGTALQNKVPGVSISQTSGKPGATTSLTIRNPVTWASTGSTTDPLFVIDGFQLTKQDFDNLDATLIESVTFLKDAAASIYGARGANGVILVKTKMGKPGKPRISYAGSYGISSATYIPEMLSGYDQAIQLNNKYTSLKDADANKYYTPDELAYLKTHNNNWIDDVWKSSHLTRHTISVSGGTDRITFFAGGNYYKENGNVGDLYVTKYGLRMGINAKIIDNLTTSISFSTDNALTNRPAPKTVQSGLTEQSDQMSATVSALLLTPGWVPMYINGRPVYSSVPGWHPQELIKTGSYSKLKSQGQTINASLDYKLPAVKGLTFRVQYGRNARTNFGKEYYLPYSLYNFVREGTHNTSQNVIFTNQLTTTNPSTLIKNGNLMTESYGGTSSYQLNESVSYDRTFGKHAVNLILVAEQSESQTDNFDTRRETVVIPGIDQLFAFSQDKTLYDNSGSSGEGGRMSYLGRLNYAFKDKFLLEATFRADASPNFPKTSQWGYFPSVAVGWKLSEEPFFKEHVRAINDFKIRFQVGLTGNDAVRNYQYKERYTQTTGMLFGSTLTSGLNNNDIPNPSITWERALYKNLGFDGTMFNRRFNFAIDLYHRYNYDMLMQPTSTVPTTFGGGISDQNYGRLKSWGLEAMLNYNGSITNDLKFTTGINFSISDNKVIRKYYGAGDTAWKNPIGRRTDNGLEGYKSTGILRTQQEVDAFMAKNPGWTIDGQPLVPGYMNYADINKDGKIDENDKTRIASRGGSLFGVGFILGASWKTLKLSANIGLQVGGYEAYDKTARTPATENQRSLAIWKDSWSTENPNAKYPLINSPLIKEVSDFWIRSGTTMRVNNMMLSYGLPQALSARWKIPDLRVFVTGTNLWSIINNQPYKDPATNLAVDYPALRTYTFGLNLSL
ncbi:TonB-linked outer membrane protein, SusC/RagA family [Chitinophaga sp. YR573]|uniref:SusC/RagA family TonB-linked outer membrane protein n=1 Tax=Chitinophaga sp. YR573 TaxID=1881040 RepID=UPI0008CE595D|nr:SusC/RagA family TonB-linked outer membrane protein [Chitinophaga sp. YR573]SEW22218.1 TonB-linked outer membrane protein, SusC/RagA family [Chitinophaga sp. YR573]